MVVGCWLVVDDDDDDNNGSYGSVGERFLIPDGTCTRPPGRFNVCNIFVVLIILIKIKKTVMGV